MRPSFDRRIKLEFRGAKITSDGGLLACREFDDALGLTDIAVSKLLNTSTNAKATTRARLGGLFRRSMVGWLAGYEDVIDAERLARDTAIRAIIRHEGLERLAASSSQISWTCGGADRCRQATSRLSVNLARATRLGLANLVTNVTRLVWFERGKQRQPELWPTESVLQPHLPPSPPGEPGPRPTRRPQPRPAIEAHLIAVWLRPYHPLKLAVLRGVPM